jgi:hypothetical protein
VPSAAAAGTKAWDSPPQEGGSIFLLAKGIVSERYSTCSTRCRHYHSRSSLCPW